VISLAYCAMAITAAIAPYQSITIESRAEDSVRNELPFSTVAGRFKYVLVVQPKNPDRKASVWCTDGAVTSRAFAIEDSDKIVIVGAKIPNSRLTSMCPGDALREIESSAATGLIGQLSELTAATEANIPANRIGETTLPWVKFSFAQTPHPSAGSEVGDAILSFDRCLEGTSTTPCNASSIIPTPHRNWLDELAKAHRAKLMAPWQSNKTGTRLKTIVEGVVQLAPKLEPIPQFASDSEKSKATTAIARLNALNRLIASSSIPSECINNDGSWYPSNEKSILAMPRTLPRADQALGSRIASTQLSEKEFSQAIEYTNAELNSRGQFVGEWKCHSVTTRTADITLKVDCQCQGQRCQAELAYLSSASFEIVFSQTSPAYSPVWTGAMRSWGCGVSRDGRITSERTLASDGDAVSASLSRLRLRLQSLLAQSVVRSSMAEAERIASAQGAQFAPSAAATEEFLTASRSSVARIARFIWGDEDFEYAGTACWSPYETAIIRYLDSFHSTSVGNAAPQ